MTHSSAPDSGTETRQIEIHEALALLRSVPVGRLAVVVDDAPDIFPVNHMVDQGTIVFRTAAGTKLSAADGRQVAFEVDGYDVAAGEAWSVVAHGIGRVVYDTDEAIEALGLPIFPWQSGAKPQVVRLTPVTITGRRFRVSGGFRDQATTATT
ncbi:MAG TPA: pyridoxamine 5'-phosphate oxidase family protein [Pedococcus sp.]|jgi:hypothetical protein|nr:pyridoxamine 5'-phosphate oxidase family protein [Pedococcus sp.]